MSVWVCMGCPLVYGKDKGSKAGEPYPKEQCPSYDKGECDINGKPCDAVEYAPKHDLDAAINERDLLQERCDELRKKIALMEEKG
jgi:hypothetical protein